MSMKSSITNMVLSLGAITIIAGALLAWVYDTTKEPIAKAETEKQVQAIRDVAPAFDNNPMDSKTEVTVDGDTEAVIVYPATNGGQLVGAAVESYTNSGFSGHFTVMFGFDADGKVNGFTVLKHEETPGLGAKMGEWFKDENVPARNVIGHDPAADNMTVSKDGGSVDAITAATITSRAFLDALRRAHTAFVQYRDSAGSK